MLRRYVPHFVFLAVVAFGLAWSITAAMLLPFPQEGRDYNTGEFLIRHSWVKFARVGTSPFRENLSEPEKDAKVARYFELNQLIADGERIAGDAASSDVDVRSAEQRLDALVDERADIENSVEEILEGRLTAVVDDLGLTRRIGVDLVWPPVSIEFERPPALLVQSPRDEIRRQDDRLLASGLPIDRRVELETEIEADGQTSALVVDVGAIAMYPAIVPPRSDYRSTLETIAHEWVHHYLFFAPLGRSFYESDRLVTLNETVANIAGDEMGEIMYERYPLERPPEYVSAAAPGTSAPDGAVASGIGSEGTRFFAALRMTAAPMTASGREIERPAAQDAFDFGREMRALRLEVDALLAAGRVEEAERLMEERRLVFVENGYYIRRINQAYFAFHGSYADTPASSDPIGPKMTVLRDQSLSLKRFLETAREFGAEDDLDSALR